MCHLLTDTSSEAQKMAYGLLQEAAKKRTEYLVIESGVDTEGVTQAELPNELVGLLQLSLNFEGSLSKEDSVSVIVYLSFIILTLFIGTAWLPSKLDGDLRSLHRRGKLPKPSPFSP